MLQVKYLKYGTCWIVTTMVIRNRLAELYILHKRIFDFGQNNFFGALPKTLYIVYVTSQMSQVWYMLDSYKWVIRNQPAELFMLKKQFSILDKKFF